MGIFEGWKRISEILDQVPDEFYEFVRTTEAELISKFEEIESICRHDFEHTPTGDRRKIADHYKSCGYPGVLFRMLDNKSYSEMIWRMIKPTYTRAFAEEPETEK